MTPQTATAKIPDLDALPDTAFLTRAQLAEITRFTQQSFKLWAKKGRGPAVTRIEGRPRYRVADARAWLAGSRAA